MQKINFDSLKLKLFIWFPVFLYAGLIFYLSGLSALPVSIEHPFLDKLEHVAEYAILGILLMRALANPDFKFKASEAFAAAVIIAFLYGISDEIHQAFVPGRSADIFDALFDLIGAGIGAYVYLRKKVILKT